MTTIVTILSASGATANLTDEMVWNSTDKEFETILNGQTKNIRSDEGFAEVYLGASDPNKFETVGRYLAKKNKAEVLSVQPLNDEFRDDVVY